MRLDEKAKKNISLALISIMVITLIVKCIYTIWGRNYLYADGAGFCYDCFKTGGFSLGIEGRSGSILLMQLPMWIAMKCGVDNIKVLCGLFGFGSVFWYPFFTLVAMCMAFYKNHLEYIANLGLLYVLINVYSGFFTQIESITAVGIFVYLLIYYIVAEKNDWGFRIIATLLLLIVYHANEYFVGYGVVLLIMILTRLIKDRKNIFLLESIIHFVYMVWTVVHSYIQTTQGASTQSLRNSLEKLPQRQYYWIMLVLILFASILVVIASFIKNKWFDIVVMVIGIGTCSWMGITVFQYTRFIATESFGMRIMNLILPCIYGGIFWIIWVCKIKIEIRMSAMVMLMLLLNSVFVIKSAEEYRYYQNQIVMACEERQGFFSIYDSGIDRSYCWGWPAPMESLLAQCLSGKKDITSIMIKQFDMQEWEAFDSDDINAYIDLSNYGIEIHKEYF